MHKTNEAFKQRDESMKKSQRKTCLTLGCSERPVKADRTKGAPKGYCYRCRNVFLHGELGNGRDIRRPTHRTATYPGSRRKYFRLTEQDKKIGLVLARCGIRTWIIAQILQCAPHVIRYYLDAAGVKSLIEIEKDLAIAVTNELLRSDTFHGQTSEQLAQSLCKLHKVL